jgi:hypothetical protein
MKPRLAVARLSAMIGVAVVAVAMTGAAPSPKINTVQVAGRVATFLQPALSGQIAIAIVYRPGDPSSESEMRQIERAIGTELVIGSLRLRPRRVADVSLRDLAGTKIAFVTSGVDYREVAVATAARSILAFGSDPACIQAGCCAVTISATPAVQIVVNKAAVKAAGLRFSSGFLMLVKEI